MKLDRLNPKTPLSFNRRSTSPRPESSATGDRFIPSRSLGLNPLRQPLAPQTSSNLGRTLALGALIGLGAAAGIAGMAQTSVVQASVSTSTSQNLTVTPRLLSGFRISGSGTDLTASSTFTGYRLRGTDRGGSTDVTLRQGFTGRHIQGTERGQRSDITVRQGLTGSRATGTYMGEDLNLRISHGLLGVRIRGEAAGGDVDVSLRSRFLSGYSTSGEGEVPSSVILSIVDQLQDSD